MDWFLYYRGLCYERVKLVKKCYEALLKTLIAFIRALKCDMKKVGAEVFFTPFKGNSVSYPNRKHKKILFLGFQGR